MARLSKEARKAIANNIRMYREKKFPGRGGSKQCADAFGVTPQRWSPWENGSRSPDPEHMKTIADFLDVTVEDLRKMPETTPAVEPIIPPEAATNLGHKSNADMINELTEMIGLLMKSLQDASSGARDPADYAMKMRELLRYAKYVMEK